MHYLPKSHVHTAPSKPPPYHPRRPVDYQNSPYFADKKLFDETSETALNELRQGKYLLIDLNTRSNFRTSKFPRISHLAEESIISRECNKMDRLTSQLSVDMDEIKNRKKRVRSLLWEQTPATAQSAQAHPPNTFKSSAKPTRLAKTEHLREMSNTEIKVLKKQ